MNVAADTGNDELRDLYRQLILDHARHPRHFGKLDGVTHTADGINPLCGDKLRLYLRVDDADRIDAASFEGTGCAISIASASLMTDLIHGVDTRGARRFVESVTSRLTGQGETVTNPALEQLRALDGVRDFPSRVKCATLAWRALNSALDNEKAPATTE